MRLLYVIGIDPGVNTGFCVWDMDRKRIHHIYTGSILRVIKDVTFFVTQYPGQVKVRFEDARKLKLPRKLQQRSVEALQGVGSIKRDCSIWEEFCENARIPYDAVDPRTCKFKKLTEESFFNITKHTGKTSNHARDACMLVFGM